ncbi:MAG: hypothetical protein WCR67_04665 [Bacilli bacterium]
MKTSDFENSLDILRHCDLVRYIIKKDSLVMLVVADLDEEERERPVKEDDELGDEQAEYTKEIETDADDGMNGHLFRLEFHDVKDVSAKGVECDNYHTLEVKTGNNHLFFKAEGINMDEPTEEVELEFSYGSYEVHDRGIIDGPDV